jgi:hypothetical protein
MQSLQSVEQVYLLRTKLSDILLNEQQPPKRVKCDERNLSQSGPEMPCQTQTLTISAQVSPPF